MRYAQIVLSVGDFFLPVHFSMVVPHYFHFQRENRTFRFLYYWMWICNESESFGSRSGPCADGVATTVLGVKSGTARTVTPRRRLRNGVGATRMIPCWDFFAPPAFACSLATAHAAICTLDRRRPSRLASPRHLETRRRGSVGVQARGVSGRPKKRRALGLRSA